MQCSFLEEFRLGFNGPIDSKAIEIIPGVSGGFRNIVTLWNALLAVCQFSNVGCYIPAGIINRIGQKSKSYYFLVYIISI